MAIPLPDFDEDDDEIFGNHAQISHFVNSGALSAFKESLIHHDMYTFSANCDPDKTFNMNTQNGISYDEDNPIYQTRTCTLFIGRKDNVFYALKTTPATKVLKHEWEVYNEVGYFPTIIKSYNYWQEPNKTCFLQLEYASGGSIANTVLYFDNEDAWRILAHITAAIDHLHSKGFIHLDISPSNILQAPGNNCIIYKLVDFGTVLKNGHFDNFCEGAGPYVSPEALRYPNTPYLVSYPTDIWSLGAVMFEIVTHMRIPRNHEGYDAIRNGTYDLSMIPNEFSFIKDMLNIDPNLRPTTSAILDIPKVKEVLHSLTTDCQPRVTFLQWIDQKNYNNEEFKRRQSFDGI